MVSTQTAPAQAGATGSQAQAPVAAPFRAGTFNQIQTDGYSIGTVLSTGAQQLTPPYTPSPNAFLRGIWIQAVCLAAGNSANVAFTGDSPLNAYQSVIFQDANQKPIVGPFDSYTLAMVNKFGGYWAMNDPRASGVYSTTTGTNAAGGSFTEILYVPLEVANRDGLGALQNKSSSSSFQLVLTVNTLAAIYSTAPTAAPTLTTTCLEDGWVQPKAADNAGVPLSQAPPQLGTTQYWVRGSYQALNGATQIQLTQGLGYPIRTIIEMVYDTSGTTRATGDGFWPNPAQYIYKGTSMFNFTKTVWQDWMCRLYNLHATAKDAALGLENGVFVLPFNRDFANAPGDELRNGYLPTQQGDQFQQVGSYSGSVTLYHVVNYVAPAAGPNNLASIRAGR